MDEFDPNGSMNHYASWYLMASYMYYHRSSSILEDEVFDNICSTLLTRWGEVTHPHKHLIHVDSLKAGTGFNIVEYPSVCKCSAVEFAIDRGRWLL